MSKVIHLSDRAHHHAKAYCQQGGLKMSEWVAQLIDQAVSGGSASVTGSPASPSRMHIATSAATPTVEEVERAARHNDAEAQEHGLEAAVPRKKKLLPTPVSVRADENLPIYEAPPFWAR